MRILVKHWPLQVSLAWNICFLHHSYLWIQLSFCSERMHPKIKRIRMCWIPRERATWTWLTKLKELCGHRSRSRNFTELNIISASLIWYIRMMLKWALKGKKWRKDKRRRKEKDIKDGQSMTLRVKIWYHAVIWVSSLWESCFASLCGGPRLAHHVNTRKNITGEKNCVDTVTFGPNVLNQILFLFTTRYENEDQLSPNSIQWCRIAWVIHTMIFIHWIEFGEEIQGLF